MFTLKRRFFNAENGGVGQSAAGGSASADAAPKAPEPPSASLDKSAIEAQAKASARAEFLAEFKASTGYDSPEAFKQAELEKQGKHKEIADNAVAKAAQLESRLKDAAIGSALALASGEAIDPSLVAIALAGKCQCDEQGNVTVDGKPVADVVKAFLADKPYLAKPLGQPGGGSPRMPDLAGGNQEMPNDNLTGLQRLQKARIGA
jgi:glycine/D-amino acid oxidase-like deaminating enzyme